MFQNITEFLEEKKREYEERAEKWSEKEESIQTLLKCNEHDGRIDMHMREQLNGVIRKQNELLAVSDFISELQEKYF